jgi:hypothetical protein
VRIDALRKRLKERIEVTRKTHEEYPENKEVKGMLMAYIDAYNISFDTCSRMHKTWKCKICGREVRAVIAPVEYFPEPHWHECEFEEVTRQGDRREDERTH